MLKLCIYFQKRSPLESNMAAPSSSDDTSNGNGARVADEKCTISGKYQDFTTTVDFSVESIKERFKEEKKTFLESHSFKVNDETFKIVAVIDKKKLTDLAAEDWWLGVYVGRLGDSSSDSIVSCDVM